MLVLAGLSLLCVAIGAPVSLITQIAIYTLYGAGVCLLVSYTGLVPFGASVFFGWTALYLVVALMGLYWIETNVASLWRARREGAQWLALEGVPVNEAELVQAGIEACSFYWAYFVAIGVLAFVVLYLV